jgi:hypothetical protein
VRSNISEEQDLTTRDYDLSRDASVSIAVRVPRVLARQVKEAAEISGTDVSTYMRNTLFAAQALTAEAVAEIRKEAAAGERRLVERELQRLRDQLAEAVEDVAVSRERVVGLERDLDLHPLRLLVLTSRVLTGGAAERQEFTEFWGHLDRSDQTQLVPAMIMAMKAPLTALPDATVPAGRDAAHRRVLASADWLIGLMEEALSRCAPHDAEPATDIPAAASDASQYGIRGKDAVEDASPEVGTPAPAFLEGSASVPGSSQETRYVGPASDDLGQVASSEERGGLEILSIEGARQEATYPVYPSPTTLGGLPAISFAELLSRVPAGTAAKCPIEPGDEDAEGRGVNTAMDALPPPQVEAQDQGNQTNDWWAPIPSEASADMWS